MIDTQILFVASLCTFAALACLISTYAAFTLSGFDDQERNLMFVKTVFPV